MDTLDATPNPPSPPPPADPPANPITSTAPVQMPPVSVPPAQGKLQLWLVSWLGASYETTIAGYVAGFGAISMAIGGILGATSTWGQRFLTAGAIITAIGAQQAGSRAKSTKVTGAEPNK